MKIVIDGDACPSISKIENLAKEYAIEVNIFVDINHFIQSDYSKVVIVDSGFQSVDMYVVNNTQNGDIVVTQDYGVAAMCLPRGASVISPKGSIYTEKNIDMLLEQRYISQKVRNAGGRFKGPRKRNLEDDERLINNLRAIIEYNIKN